MPHPMFEKHSALLHKAIAAVEARAFWSPFSENPASYGESAIEKGRIAFEAYRAASFYLDQPDVVGRGGEEVSPFGLPLNITYPLCNPDALIIAARMAMHAWTKADADVRAGVCLEILSRLNKRSMEMAHALIHTTGQPFAVAFQYSTVNAQGRGLEAVAVAYREMKQMPASAIWEKPQGTSLPLKIEKSFTITPRGIALIIASSVAPTLNGYPALFASLVTGNAVIVKAHPGVILPLAITVAIARQTLKEAGFDANLVTLLIDDAATPSGKILALNPDIRIIDFTGNSEFGEWIEEHATHAAVFTQKSSVNCVVVDSTSDYKGMLRNLTLSLCLYSGQICAAPRVLLVSREGVQTPDGLVSSEQFGKDMAFAIGNLMADPVRAVELLGALRSGETLDRIHAARDLGEVLRDSFPLAHPQWPEARVHTPLLLKIPVSDEAIYAREHFGPILMIVETATSAESLAVAERVMRDKGALMFAVHSVNPRLHQFSTEIALRVGVALSLNLTGELLINQENGFTDLHGSGANRSGNAAYIDSTFVARRFQIAGTRRQVVGDTP